MNKKKLLASLFLTLASLNAFCQPPTDDYDDLTVPINNWIPVVALLAVAFAFYLVKKTKSRNSIA